MGNDDIYLDPSTRQNLFTEMPRKGRSRKFGPAVSRVEGYRHRVQRKWSQEGARQEKVLKEMTVGDDYREKTVVQEISANTHIDDGDDD